MQEKSNTVVFYGAGNYAATVFEFLNKKYKPVAYGDNDDTKHGAYLGGLPILSFENINARYPGCRFYVTVNETVKLDVITSLINKGVTSGRIINFEKSRRYRSCRFLETYMLHWQSELNFCCSDFEKNNSPIVRKLGNAHEETLREFFSTRDRIIDALNTPNAARETDGQNPCAGCWGCCEVRDGIWNIDRRIRQVNFNYRSFCNFKCVYCAAHFDEVKVDDSFRSEVESALEFFYFLKDRNYIDTDTVIENASGEISTHPLRDKILTALQDHPCWFYSNASVYNEKVGEILSRGRSNLISSIDAGTRKTFAKIKGVDLFDRVCENLGRYARDGFVELKYVIMPGLNDNEQDVSGLIAFCERAKIKRLDISRNMHDMRAFNEHTVDMSAMILREARKLGINVSMPDWLFTGTGDKQRIEIKLKASWANNPG